MSLLTASSTACISAHSIVVVVSNATVVDPSDVERLEGVDVLPLPDATVVWLETVPLLSPD